MQQSTPKVQTENFGSSQISTAAVDNQISLYEKQIASLSEKEYYTVTAPIDGRIILSDNERGCYPTIYNYRVRYILY